MPFRTAEPDGARAAAAAGLFRDDPNVRVLAGDWRETLPPEAPFDLLFVAAGEHVRPREDGELAAGLLAPGGLAVLAEPAPAVRELWLGGLGLAAVDLATAAGDTALLAVRR